MTLKSYTQAIFTKVDSPIAIRSPYLVLGVSHASHSAICGSRAFAIMQRARVP